MSNWNLDRFGFGGDEERSETIALAEGSLSNTDNDDEDHENNVGNLDSDSENDRDQPKKVSINTDQVEISKVHEDNPEEISDNH